jgi:phosphatidylglycerophosphate synthase
MANINSLNLDDINISELIDSDYEIVPENINFTEDNINTNKIIKPKEKIKEVHKSSNQEMKPKVILSNAPPKPSSEEEKKPNMAKYEDDSLFESFADNKIFFPLSDLLIDPLKKAGFVPNQITYLSTICTVLAIYYITIDEYHFAMISYGLGYLLDCVDGRMARKYKMTSKEGMILDLVTDHISNLCLMLYLVHKYGFYNWRNIMLAGFTLMITLSYGVNEAIYCYKKNKHDDFLKVREEEIGTSHEILDNLFLFITARAYATYKTIFPEWDEEKLFKWLPLLKEFGPGNFAVVVLYILYSYGTENKKTN